MFRKIVVPLDGSPTAAAALPAARTLAKAAQADVLLVRVAPATDEGPEQGRQVAEAERSLARVATELAGAELRVSTQVRHGAAAEEIVGATREQHGDAVVMATHGRSGLPRALLGSVAERVVASSPVPVLLVRPGGQRMTRLETLLVPVDGTPGGALALSAAIGLARAAGARIVLLEVAVPVPLWLFASEGGALLAANVDPSWDTQAQEAAATYVGGLARRIGQTGLEAEGRAEIGDPTAVVAATADQVGADLVVMSTHALTGPARAVLGSVAGGVVRTAGRPVLLIRRDRRADVQVRISAQDKVAGTAPALAGGG